MPEPAPALSELQAIVLLAADETGGIRNVHVHVTGEEAQAIYNRLYELHPSATGTDRTFVVAVFARPGQRPLRWNGDLPAREAGALLDEMWKADRS